MDQTRSDVLASSEKPRLSTHEHRAILEKSESVSEITTLIATNPTLLKLRPCPLHEIPALFPERARRVFDLPSEAVTMRPLDGCSAVLSTIDISENAPHQPWHQNAFTSCAPSVFEINDAIVHGAVGITATSDVVVSETLWHTATDRHRYEWRGTDCEIRYDHIETLQGRHASILTGAAESYWHAVFDATARLGLITDEMWSGIDGLLIPSTGVRQSELVELYGVPSHVAVRVVEPGETFAVETLILPSSIHILFDYHPKLVDAVYERIRQSAAPRTAVTGRRVFIDRRGSGLRRLLNEEEIIEALTPLGFEAIQLETLTIAEQASLFADAAIIVGPHGAGLTNIGFAREGAVVVEFMMDAYLNWCYRRIAAIRRLQYHCVVGHSTIPVSEPAAVVHARTWTVDLQQVRAIVSDAIETSAFGSSIT